MQGHVASIHTSHVPHVHATSPPVVAFLRTGDASEERISQLVAQTSSDAVCCETLPEVMERCELEQPSCLIVEVPRELEAGRLLLREVGGAVRTWQVPTTVLILPLQCALAVEAARTGAFAILFQPLAPTDLAREINRAITHDLEGEDAPLVIRKRLASLSRREREIMQHMLQGLNTKSMASQFGVCYQTIDKHRAKVKTKMKVKSEVALLRLLSTSHLPDFANN